MSDNFDYPSDVQLAQIEQFRGDAPGFFDEVTSAWNHAMGSISSEFDEENERTVHAFVTGGWSGNEAVISTIERTMFNSLFWESSHRGGKHVYVVPESQKALTLEPIVSPAVGECGVDHDERCCHVCGVHANRGRLHSGCAIPGMSSGSAMRAHTPLVIRRPEPPQSTG